MNISKAIGAGILVFVLQIGVASVVNNVAVPLLSLINAGTWLSYAWQAVMGLLLAAIVYFVARWYFGAQAGSFVSGLYLGLVMVATGFALVLLQTLPALAYGQSITSELMGYVGSVAFMLTAGITLVAATFAGYMKRSVHCNVKDAVGTCMPEEAKPAAPVQKPFEVE